MLAYTHPPPPMIPLLHDLRIVFYKRLSAHRDKILLFIVLVQQSLYPYPVLEKDILNENLHILWLCLFKRRSVLIFSVF